MKRFLLPLFCIVLVAFSSVTARSPELDEKFIQGSWRAAGESGRHAWFLEWTFAAGKFKLDGYPPLHQEGSYRIVHQEDNKLALELYDQQGTFGTENSRIEITSGKDEGTLMIRGQGPFRRTKTRSAATSAK